MNYLSGVFNITIAFQDQWIQGCLVIWNKDGGLEVPFDEREVFTGPCYLAAKDLVLFGEYLVACGTLPFSIVCSWLKSDLEKDQPTLCVR